MEPTKRFAKGRGKSVQSVIRIIMFASVVIGLTGCAHFNQVTPEPITVPQILKMAKEGIPADDMIARMKVSGTVYRLKASQLAKLKEAGVPAKVIDYMQQTYLDAVKNDARYGDLRYWGLEDEFGWYGGVPYGWPDDEEHLHDY
jgi:hypothetical protein